MTDTLTAQRKARLADALAEAPFDAFLAVSSANLLYATGYRSLGASVFGQPVTGAFATGDRTIVAGPVADAGSATVEAVAAGDYVPYGRFYFASEEPLPEAFTPDLHSGFANGLRAAAVSAGLASSTIGVDEAAINPNTLAQLSLQLPDVRFVDASSWALRVRSSKLPGEVALLERAARLAEDGVAAAIDAAHVGMTERELASVVNQVITKGGGEPRFSVASSGPHSALADVYVSDRALAVGDLLRFDVGCVVDGYWSDIGRTAVVGEPTALQRQRYDAILEGEARQLERVRPGVRPEELFALAVRVVEDGGIRPYRRQHCGHGIGLDVYEPPIINDRPQPPIEAGTTFCFETPYYEIGWGGMMVEDTVVVTEDGHRRFTVTERDLRVIPV